MDKVDELFNKVYDINSPVVFFPIRHHSPACSMHLKNTVLSYNPDIILIEGPNDTNSLNQYLINENSKPPFSIYYSFEDKDNLTGTENGKFSCYYPMLDYSPELVALKLAAGRSVPSEFIDLPYYQFVIEESKFKPSEEDDHANSNSNSRDSYYDDYFMARSKYVETLCHKQNCRDYSELWEKLFEIDGLYYSTPDFVKAVFAMCYFSRIDYPQELLDREICLVRERFMAERIKEHMKSYKKILVVTGGFHTSSIVNLINEDIDYKCAELENSKISAYVIPYSFDECDQLSGYASGMPYPAFYQKVWEGICDNIAGPYNNSVMYNIIKIGEKLRRQKENISIPDEASALYMAGGLRNLRGKKDSGVYELLDGIRAAYIKGDINVSTEHVFKLAYQILKGDKIGSVCDTAELPPIVLDFRNLSKKYNLKINTTIQQEITLDILSNKKHRKLSIFMHMLLFLNVGFCEQTYGPNYSQRKNTDIVREKWKYHWNGRIDSNLVEISVYGATIEEAAISLMEKALMDEGNTAESVSKLLIDCCVMELFQHADRITAKIESVIQGDGSFFSIVNCALNLSFVNNSKWMLNFNDKSKIDGLINKSFVKAAGMVSSLTAGDGKEDENIAHSLKDLAYLASQDINENSKDILTDGLLALADKSDCPPCMHGASCGLLYGMGAMSKETINNKANGYFYGTGEEFKKSGIFLKGIFYTARDVLFYGDEFLAGLENVLLNLDYEDFLTLVPDLRLAFTYFTPPEINDIASNVAGLHGLKKENILWEKAFDEGLRLEARKIDQYAAEVINSGG
ncbi:MAG: DUF5682 family protein [Clostridiales bacterium]|jgi:hypothetical protein|nr:DUF5682 family protein [Clostridiales bacterium]